MRSVSGVDLVRGALQSSLARAQRNYNFHSPKSKLSIRDKKRARKEKQRLNRFQDQFPPLQNNTPQQNHNSRDCFDIPCETLEFEEVDDQVSSLISSLRNKYTCLNPDVLTSGKQKKRKQASQLDKQNIKSNCIRDKEVVPISKQLRLKGKNQFLKGGRQDDSLPRNLNNDENLEELAPTVTDDQQGIDVSQKGADLENPYELLQQLKEKRKERRKRKKEALKVARLQKLKSAQSVIDINCERTGHLVQVLKGKNSNQTPHKSQKHKKSKMKESLDNSGCGSVNGSSSSQLSQPRVVLYAREKVVPGWKQRLPIGCGLINLGNSCYMNASLQALFHTPAFVNWLLDDNDHRLNCRNNGQCIQSCIICAMHNTLKESLNRQHQCLRPLQIHNKLKVICKHFTHGRQEDAHEFLRYLLESMERSYLAALNMPRLDNRSKETTPLGQIFGGYIRTEVTCLKCNFISTTFQPLAELQLDIRHVTTLEDAIQNHFKKERLDNNDYKCEKCHAISPATKQFSLEIPPIVLCLQLKRFTLFGNKIAKPVHCNRSLNLSRYLHKSQQDVGHSDVKYRLVALVTHMGSSPNCGHYTAIAEASNGNFYQFDDSLVRQVSTQTALNTDAYVIIYELDRNQTQSNTSSSLHNFNFGLKSSTVTTSTVSTSINGNGHCNSTLNNGRLGSPMPVQGKKFTIPFVKSLPENSALRNATTSSSSFSGSTVTSVPSKINGNSSSISLNGNDRLLNGNGLSANVNSHNKEKMYDIKQPSQLSLTSAPANKINVLKPGLVLTNSSKLFSSPSTPNVNEKSPVSGINGGIAQVTTNFRDKMPKSPVLESTAPKSISKLTNGVTYGPHKPTIQLVPYDEENDEDTSKTKRRERTPEKIVEPQLPATPPKSPKTPPKSPKLRGSSPSLQVQQTKILKTPQIERLSVLQQAEQQFGVKRKLDEFLGKKEIILTENKQPRLTPEIEDVEKVEESKGKANEIDGNIRPLSATSPWTVITNKRQVEPLKKSSRKSSGYSSDPESKVEGSRKLNSLFRAKSMERIYTNINMPENILKNATENNNLKSLNTPEKRKSPIEIVDTSHISPNQQEDSEKNESSVKINGFSSRHRKESDRGNSHIKKRVRSKSSSSSSSTSSSSSSDEKHRNKSSKHKKKAKKSKSKKKSSKSKKSSKRSSSGSSWSSSDDDELELLKKKRTTNGPKKVLDKYSTACSKVKKDQKKKKEYDKQDRRRSPNTTTTELSDEDHRKRSKLTSNGIKNTDSEGKKRNEYSIVDNKSLTPVRRSRSISQERERDRRKNRNPSRSRSRSPVVKGKNECDLKNDSSIRIRSKDKEQFDLTKLLNRDKQVVSWNGKESTLSKVMEGDRKRLHEKTKEEVLDDEIDSGRTKKSRKFRSPSHGHESPSVNGFVDNKFQNYEEKRRNVSQWSKVLDGYGDNFKDHKSNNPGRESRDYQDRKGFEYNNGSRFGGRPTGSFNKRNHTPFRNVRTGRGEGFRPNQGANTGYHYNKFRGNRDRT